MALQLTSQPQGYEIITSAQAPSTGFWGNIWDVVKSTATEIIKTGGNVLMEKYSQPTSIVYPATTGYPSFAPKTNSPEVVYNPSEQPLSPYATDIQYPTSSIIQFVTPKPTADNDANDPQQLGGIPVWLWVGLGFLGLIVLTKGTRR